MSLQTACFISYRHSRKQEVIDFVRAIHDELDVHLSIVMQEKPFWDESLDYGEQFNDSLAAKLSASACMLVVYTPVYPLSEYCRGEFQGMQELEARRRAKLGDKAEQGVGMIIPLVLKKNPKDYDHDDPWLPDEVRGKYNPLDLDLSQYFLRGAKSMRRDVNFKRAISRIADYVFRVKSMIERDPDHCSHQIAAIPRGVPAWGAVTNQQFPLR